jgi:hypothetical protein
MPKKLRLYDLTITLTSPTDAPIWRRVQLPAALTLASLHAAIQAAFGWSGAREHAFLLGDGLDETYTRLYNILPGVGGEFIYLYDFGDGWEHRVRVENVLDVDAAVSYPHLVAGAGATPPEDSGGPLGYAQALLVLDDPEHEAHGVIRDLFGLGEGAAWDASAFDAPAVQARLDLLSRKEPRRG